MTAPSAKVIAHSASRHGQEIVTVEATLHHYVAKELLTHCALARNAASQRAIPYEKIRQQVLDSPAIPPSWGTRQKGMQAGPPLVGQDAEEAEADWRAARRAAIEWADRLNERGVHKSLINRLLEPFLWTTYIITATEWDGFFKQRCHPDAEEAMRLVAEAIRDAIAASKPTSAWLLPVVEGRRWHLPYVGQQDLDECEEHGVDPRHVSAARVARVSYLTHDGVRDVREDEGLWLKLVDRDPLHASPLEHPAMPDSGWQGKFWGWKSLRQSMGV